MPEFNSLKEIFKYFHEVTEDIVQNEVKDEALKEVTMSITDMYNAYEPKKYERAYDMYDGNTVFEEFGNGEYILVITNSVNKDGKDVSKVVSTGQGYSFPDVWGYGYETPRPFMKWAQQNLKDGKLAEIVRSGYKRRGVSIV
jgi:hypothetical protein